MNNEIIIYHNPKCSKSRKALEIIKNKNIEPTIVAYLKNKLSKTEVENLLTKLRLSIRDILRTGEDEYNNNNLKNEKLSNDKLIDNSLIRKTHNELTRQYNYSKFKMAIWG